MEGFTILRLTEDYNIYLNIEHFAKCRGIKFNPPEFPMKEEIFITNKNTNKYIVINTEDTSFLLIPLGSDQNKKDKLSKLISKKVTGKKLFIIKNSKVLIKEINFPDYEIIDGDRYLSTNWADNFARRGNKIRRVSEDDDEWKLL